MHTSRENIREQQMWNMLKVLGKCKSEDKSSICFFRLKEWKQRMFHLLFTLKMHPTARAAADWDTSPEQGTCRREAGWDVDEPEPEAALSTGCGCLQRQFNYYTTKPPEKAFPDHKLKFMSS